MEVFLLVIAGYLLGSMPTAYIAGRLLKGRDLRQYGGGTVSGTGVYYHIARWAVVPVGVSDLAKAALPVWLGTRLGLGLPAALMAGLAAVVGHNWPIWLNFKGGRGIGPFMGLLLIVFPWGFPWLLGSLALGRLLGETAVGALLGLITLPLLTRAVGQPPAVIWACLAMLVLTAIKRVEANRLPLPEDPRQWRRVLLRRLVMDRDVGRRAPWTERKPRAEARERT